MLVPLDPVGLSAQERAEVAQWDADLDALALAAVGLSLTLGFGGLRVKGLQHREFGVDLCGVAVDQEDVGNARVISAL